MLLRGGLSSEIALQGGSLEFKIVYRGVGADFEKPKNICMKRGEKWFPEKISKFLTKIIFGPSHSRPRTSKGRTPASELVLLRGGLPSEIALLGESLFSKIVYRGEDANFEKQKQLFRLKMNMVT